jgi:hypothetical protein
VQIREALLMRGGIISRESFSIQASVNITAHVFGIWSTAKNDFIYFGSEIGTMIENARVYICCGNSP